MIKEHLSVHYCKYHGKIKKFRKKAKQFQDVAKDRPNENKLWLDKVEVCQDIAGYYEDKCRCKK